MCGAGDVRGVDVALHLAQCDRRGRRPCRRGSECRPRSPSSPGSPGRGRWCSTRRSRRRRGRRNPRSRRAHDRRGEQCPQLLVQPPSAQLAEQHHEQRRHVDRPVVGRAHPPGWARRAVEARLVHDPPGLFLRPGVDAPLEVGESLQHSQGQRGVDRQCHQEVMRASRPNNVMYHGAPAATPVRAARWGREQAERPDVGDRPVVGPRQRRVVGVQGGSVLDPLGLAGCGVPVGSGARADRSTHSSPSATSTVHVALTQTGATAPSTVQVNPLSSSATSPAPSWATTRGEVARPARHPAPSRSTAPHRRRTPAAGRAGGDGPA